MKYFVQYLQPSVVNPSELIEVCGDRGVFILDGRNKLENLIKDAHDHNYNLRGYDHFRIMKGDFREARSVYTTVPNEPLNIRAGY